MNEYSTSNVVNFTKNNQLWGQLYVTPMLENNPKMNFAAGIKIDGEIVNSAINYNAISFDGFSSLTDLINAQAYFAGLAFDHGNMRLAFIGAG